MQDRNQPLDLTNASQQAQTGSNLYRSRPMFVNLKNRLHLPGITELLAPCTQHLTSSQYKRMMSAWQSMDQFAVYGFVQYSKVIGIISIELDGEGSARMLSIAVQPNQQRWGLGRRLVVESFCSLNLDSLTAKTLEDNLVFYKKLNFLVGHPQSQSKGYEVYSCILTRQAMYQAYAHEYSAGAVLYREKNGAREYVLVTELSGNTGLPKGHLEAGETEEVTALREIYEETGITATLVPGFDGQIVYPQGRGMLKHFTYFLAVFDGSQEPESGVDVIAHLLPYAQALRKLSFADVRSILKKAEEFLNSRGK